MTDEVKKLKELIDGTDNIVFFGGAGVSAESGIPDFRSVDGLYHQQWDDPPETILTPELLAKLLAKSANATLPASRDVGPKRIAGGLLAISVGATVLAALAAFGVVRLRIKWKKRKSRSKH